MRPAARGVLPGEPGRLEVPKLHCRGCGRPVPKGRRNWCGDECVERHLVRNNPAHARRRVFERDRGVCAGCGRDCEALRERVARWLRKFGAYSIRQHKAERLLWRIARCNQFSHLWEADHIVPVVEGGGGCGLENLRTLCSCCHKRVTRALARRRAEARRAQLALALEPTKSR